MKKLYRKGTVHPSPPPPSSSQPISDHHLAFLPATILTLTIALSPQDKEVLAYLLSCSTTSSLFPCNNRNAHKSSSFTTTTTSYAIATSHGVRSSSHRSGISGDHPTQFNCNCNCSTTTTTTTSPNSNSGTSGDRPTQFNCNCSTTTSPGSNSGTSGDHPTQFNCNCSTTTSPSSNSGTSWDHPTQFNCNCFTTTTTSRGTESSSSGISGDHSTQFNCSCFRCYMSYWARWDSSPNRQLIHEIIDAFEDDLVKKEKKNKKDRRKKLTSSRGGSASELPTELTQLPKTEFSESNSVGNNEVEVGDDGEKGSVRKIVNFLGERIWGVWT